MNIGCSYESKVSSWQVERKSWVDSHVQRKKEKKRRLKTDVNLNEG